MSPATHPDQPPRPKRRRVRWIGLTCAATLLVAALLAVVSGVPVSSGLLREKIVATLSDRLDARVELGELRIRAFPRFHAEATGLTLRHRDRQDAPPFLVVRKLTVDADVMGLWRKHVRQVALEGLEINIAPNPGGDDGRRPTFDAKDVVVDRLVSRDGRLVIIPRAREKSPRVWAIHDLTMQSVSFGRAMPFEATVTNAIPTGEVHTKGSFGPWRADDPGATPLEGTFTFAGADLSVFKGVSGILSAHGEFGGSLGRLGVHGETDTPDFTVTVGGHRVHLHADYHTTVDGTNGDTLLDRIDASFLNTSIVAKGGVVETRGRTGRVVTLDLAMDKARLEDVLRLAVKTQKPPMVGALRLRTTFVLPPGDEDVVEKLELGGQFAIERGRFTNPEVQQKIDALSRRSRGRTPGERPENVTSTFVGRFGLDGGALTLAGLTFDTPGARVQLAGTYGLRSERLNFAGMLLMDATISETQKGWKRLLLKQFDPIFEREGGKGGTALPIKIEGLRANPRFGMDARRLFHRGD